jgi:hypothetical protein
MQLGTVRFAAMGIRGVMAGGKPGLQKGNSQKKYHR